MKKIVLILAAGLILNLSVMAQEDVQKNGNAKKDLVTSIDLGVGYVPKSSVEAFRISGTLNNLAFKRFGVYTAFEKNFSTDYFSHIIGITGSINHFIYLYGGIDFFSKNGVFELGDGCRKDFGVGINPFSWALVKIGYSNTVGPLAEVGVRIPLGKN